ncbi:hypothetical protein [Streptomyces tendae]
MDIVGGGPSALDKLTTGAYRHETDLGSVIAVRVEANRHRRRSD